MYFCKLTNLACMRDTEKQIGREIETDGDTERVTDMTDIHTERKRDRCFNYIDTLSCSLRLLVRTFSSLN